MKIQNIHIDGFGHFHNTPFKDIAPGLTVFQGPNEAGKSTLLAFISFILFGPSRKQKYDPLAGGKHGGQINFTDSNNTRFTIQRHHPKHKHPTIADQASVPLEPHVFKTIIGDADEKIFRSVFAFTLDELTSLDSLKDSGAQDRIFSASIAGASNSPHLIIKELDKQADVFMKSRLSQITGLGKIKHQLELLTQELQNAQRLALGYAPLKQDADAAQVKLDALKQSLGKLSQQRDQTKRLLDLHDIFLQWRDATEELNAMPSADPNLAEQLALDTTSAQNLTVESKAYRSQLSEITKLDHQRQSHQNTIKQGLADLGADWTLDRLSALDTSLAAEDHIREFERTQTQFQQAASNAEKDGALAQRNHQQAVSETQHVQRQLDAIAPVDEENLRRAQAASRRLRTVCTELATLNGSLVTLMQNDVSPQEQASVPSLKFTQNIAISLSLALAAIGVGGWRWTQADSFGAIVLLLVGAAMGFAAWRANLYRIASSHENDTPSANEIEIQKINQRIDMLTRELRELVAIIGIGEPTDDQTSVSDLTIEEADEHINHLRELAQQRRNLTGQLNEFTRRADEAAVELKAVTADSTTAQARLATHADDWTHWRNQWGVSASITPVAASSHIRAARALRVSLEKNDEIATAFKHTTSEIAAYETRVRDLTSRWSDSNTQDSNTLTSEQLIQALALATTRISQAASAITRRQSLVDNIKKLNRQLDARLGVDQHGQALRAQLAQGSIDQWQSELAELESEIAEIDTHRQQQATDLGALQKEIRDLECSANIPDIQDQIQSQRAQLADAARQWAVAKLARSIVHETLQQFVRERQPAVLNSASAMLAQITEGAYTRVIQSDDAQSLNVLDDRDRPKQPQALSRGTREQLYTCLRLALASEYANQGVALPMVLDDIMVNFDPHRAHAMAKLLIDFSKTHQLFLFTCQPATVDLLRDIDPAIQIINLPRFAGADAPA